MLAIEVIAVPLQQFNSIFREHRDCTLLKYLVWENYALNCIKLTQAFSENLDEFS
jgi:hypothetical protein